MTMIHSPEQDEQLIAAARRAFSEPRARSERVCYYRCPQHTTDGAPHKQAGWIIWGDTQQSVRIGNIARGYIPLDQELGYIQAKRRDDDPDGPFELSGHWGPLLWQPLGVRLMPKEQILAYHWYDVDRLRYSLRGQIPPTLKVKGKSVLWPQLAGEEIRVFACPECTDWRNLEAVELARHLRIYHAYDRADIIAFGQQYGVDFSNEINRNGRVIRGYAFEPVVEEPEPEDDPSAGFTLEVAMPKRGPGRPRKED